MEHAGHAHKAYLCSGENWPAHGGSWIGHVLPGVVLVAWGLHWFISASFQSLTGIRKQPLGASHKVVFLPGTLQVNTQPYDPHIDLKSCADTHQSCSCMMSLITGRVNGCSPPRPTDMAVRTYC